MTGKYLELELRTPEGRGKHGNRLAGRLVALLYASGRLMTRKEIMSHDFPDRGIRLACEKAHGRILSLSNGLIAFKWASQEQRLEAINLNKAKADAYNSKNGWIFKRMNEIEKKEKIA